MEQALPYHDLQLVYYAVAAALLPFAAFILNSFIPGKSSKVSGWASSLAILLSMGCAVLVFAGIWNKQPVHLQHVWFSVGYTHVTAGVWLNNLSALMLLLVTVISSAVHVYSTAYMAHDERYNRYFAYLSLFCFSMLALVIVDNLVLFYAFWELVGFSSYLLIGFWFTRDKAVKANKKAFIMNRIGDIGLLTAIIIIFVHFQTFDLEALFGKDGWIANSSIHDNLWLVNNPVARVNELGDVISVMPVALPAVWQYIACAGIFLGVAAKSAQFPLHTWLPDAMEGPTSVSALIHAATMVAVGVLLLGRVYPFFTDTELTILAIIGCFTAFMSATIALTQNDLKRILAYSTISQMGFMVMAMGIGAYASSLLHLVTHAFFKCLLFLCAGIVIHEMQHIKDEYQLDIDPQNILYMGGLRKKLPLTFIASIIGALALIGIPFTSGYLSKDGILIQAFTWAEGKGGMFVVVPAVALLSGVLTAFYVARMIFKVFFGEFQLKRIYDKIELHISDGGAAYKAPLILLSLCSLFPLFSFNPFQYEDAWLYKGISLSGYFERMNIYHTIIPLAVLVLSILVIYWAYAIYVAQRSLLFHQDNFFFRLSYNQWYIDQFYHKVVVKAVLAFSHALFWFDKIVIDGFLHLLTAIAQIIARVAAWTDQHLVDGFLNLLVLLVKSISNFARGFQAGKVQYYLFSMLALMLALFIYKILI